MNSKPVGLTKKYFGSSCSKIIQLFNILTNIFLFSSDFCSTEKSKATNISNFPIKIIEKNENAKISKMNFFVIRDILIMTAVVKIESVREIYFNSKKILIKILIFKKCRIENSKFARKFG